MLKNYKTQILSGVLALSFAGIVAGEEVNKPSEDQQPATNRIELCEVNADNTPENCTPRSNYLGSIIESNCFAREGTVFSKEERFARVESCRGSFAGAVYTTYDVYKEDMSFIENDGFAANFTNMLSEGLMDQKCIKLTSTSSSSLFDNALSCLNAMDELSDLTVNQPDKQSVAVLKKLHGALTK